MSKCTRSATAAAAAPPPPATVFGRVVESLNRCPATFLAPHSGAEIREYARFVALKAHANDLTAAEPTVRPSARVDAVWHAHLLLPAYYTDMCNHALGGALMHHDPATEQQPGRDAAYQDTLRLYATVFGAPPDAVYWPAVVVATAAGTAAGAAAATVDATAKPFTITVTTLTGVSYSLIVGGNAVVAALKKHVSARTNTPVEQLRLIYGGMQLENDADTLRSYGMGEGSIVHVVLRLRGC